MDIEQLTKSQIILLTLLVSFVTSIATGIVTVALMQQAPPAIVQSVNKVIRETVAQVAPNIHAQSAAAAPTQAVIVSDADMIASAVEKASRSVVRLYSSGAADPQFLGLGVVIDSSGLVATDISAIGGATGASIKSPDGSLIPVSVIARNMMNGVAYFSPISTSTDVKSLGSPAAFPSSALALGTRVVALGGVSVSRIQPGFVTALLSDKDSGSVPVIETDVPRSDILAGMPIIDTDGRIVGLSTEVSRAISGNGFIPASVFTDQGTDGKMAPKAASGE